MKKITLLFILFYSILSFGQETFEGAWPPPGWAVTTGTAFGGSEIWHLNTDDSAFLGHNSEHAAYVNRENVLIGNTEEDWLIMDQRTIPADGQLRFWTRQTLSGVQGTLYQIRVSTSEDQMNLGSYQIIQTWTEDELQDLNLPTTNVYEEKAVDFAPIYIGDQVFVAFVRVFTQPNLGVGGDRWLIDDVNIVQKCKNPTNLDAPLATILSSSALLTFDNNSISSNFELEILIDSETPTGVATHTGSGISLNVTGLLPATCYQFYVRSVCPASPSEWSGPRYFCTLPLGSVCADPIQITALPYQVISGITGNYGDEVDTPQGTGCGATPAATNYLAGAEVFYDFVPAVTGVVSVTMTPLGTSPNSSIFVYEGCANVGVSCVAGAAFTHSNVRTFNINVTAGLHYIIVISSGGATNSITYGLLIQSEDCQPKPTELPTTNQTLTSADLNWTSDGITSWEVAVQPFGSTIPTGPGEYYVGELPYEADGLNPATRYQYWVRSECGVGSGVFSAWAGPFYFNTLLCEAADKCTYAFIMTDTGNNGWQNARIEVRQAGIVVETLGPTFTAGGGPEQVNVLLCDGLPIELVWVANGSAPTQTRLQVYNTFSQLVYAKSTAATIPVGTMMYNDLVECDVPQCDITPVNVTIPPELVTTTGFTINWSAVATTSWDIFIVEAGSTPPNAGSVPTYDDITVADPVNPSFATIQPLLPDTAYDVYVRVNCEPEDSGWSAVTTVTTLPTCFKPTNLAVTTASITTTSAEVTWSNGSLTDDHWEILLMPGPDEPSFPPDPSLGILFDVNTQSPFIATGLQPATIYYYYIRTVCPGDDKSVWPVPVKFNTKTCEEVDKCNYVFVQTDAGANGWNGGRMQVRQNGILIAELTMTSGSTKTTSVGLCPGIPFDVYWNVAGTQPGDMGIWIQNPFLDVLFTKGPGEGAPLSVVYAGVTNCTPAPCSKPTEMTATDITATTAVLSWLDNATPPTDLFDVYVVVTGGAPPINDPATAPTHVGVPNNFPLTGLTPSTSYTYYVRASCGDGVHSTWTILSPYSFVTKPLNDECVDAQTVTVNPDQECNIAFTAHGSTRGGSASLPVATPGAGCGTVDDDVWFKFVATDTSHMINFSNVVGTPASVKVNHSVYSGSCAEMVLMYCSTAVTTRASELTIGETYYIRVYTPGTNLAQYATFDLCITSPPVNDDCAASINVPVNPTRVCDQLVSGYTLGATLGQPAAPAGTGCGTVDDDIWYHFTATAPTHIITISNLDPSVASVNINHSLMAGNDCGVLTQLYCSDGNVSVATNLTIGNVYKVRIYTLGTNVAQYTRFDLCITTPPPVQNDDCATAQAAYVNPGLDCLQSNPGFLAGATPSVQPPGTNCTGTEDDDVWYTFIPNSDKMTIAFDNIEGPSPLMYSIYSGTCDGLVLMDCGTTSVAGSSESVADNLIEGQIYYIRVWSTVATPQDITYDLCITRLPPPIYGSSTVYNTIPPEPFTVQSLIEDVLIGQQDQCAAVSNITWSTGTNIGVNGIGYFNKANSDFGIAEGIILSTSSANSTPGPNDTGLSEGTNAWLGDDDIEQVVFEATGDNSPFHNASIVEFDFIPYIDHIEFPFIFASEEYGGFQCDYSDAFAFLLTGPDGVTTNLAVVPGGDDPISVVTIRDNAYNGGCNSVNEEYFAHYFGAGGTNPLAAPIDFNGMTVKFTAQSDVIAGATYHIKLVIADRLDSAFDSAVFIGKFQIGSPPEIGEDLLLANGNALCNEEPYMLTATIEDPELYTFQWSDALGELEGETNQTLVITAAGTYKVKATKDGTPCFQEDTITVEYFNDIDAGLPENLVMCDATGNADFNLTLNNDNILLPFVPDSHSVAYYENEQDAIDEIVANVILTPEDYPGVHDQDIFVRVEDIATGCEQIVQFKLIVQDLTPQYTLSGDMAICPEGTTTITVVPTDGNFDPTAVSYVWEYIGVPIPDETSSSLVISGADLGNYAVTVNNSGCTYTTSFEIIENDIPWVIDISSSPEALCPFETGVITANVTNNTNGAAVTYTYTLPSGTEIVSTNNTLTVQGPGTYSVSVDILGCTSSPQEYVINNGTGEWDLDIDAPDTLCIDETGTMSVTVTNAPAGESISYTFTLPDGSSTTSSNNSITVSDIGIFQVSVSILGCPSVPVAHTITETVPDWDVTFSEATYLICPGESASLAFTAAGFDIANPNATYTWTLPDGSQAAGATLTSSQLGEHMLEVDIFGCKYYEQVIVEQDTDSFGITFEDGCDGNVFKLTALPDGGSFDPLTATYSWTGTGTMEPLAPTTATVIVKMPGTYTVTVTTPDGCFTEKEFVVDLVRCKFQKGISPDNNGENDSFDLTGYNVKHISIYNRYGTMVFQWDNYTDQWRGQDNSGDELTDGTYFYVLDVGAGREESGWIYLNR